MIINGETKKMINQMATRPLKLYFNYNYRNTIILFRKVRVKTAHDSIPVTLTSLVRVESYGEYSA